MLLAMKLVAVGHRPRRDADDVAVLLSATGVTAADEARGNSGGVLPGDGLPLKIYAIVEALLAQGPRVVRTPEPPDFA